MDDRDLKLECLRLAKDPMDAFEETVEKAKAYWEFIQQSDPVTHKRRP